MFKIITIPFNRIQKGFDDEVLNKFLLNKKVKSYRAEFFEDGGDKYWTLMVEYDPVLQKGSKKYALREIRTFLGDQLKLTLNSRSTFLNSRLNGLPFLGFRIFPNVIRVKRENLKRVKGKLKERKKEFHAGLITEDSFVMSVRSMFDHLSFADSFHLRSSVFVPRAGVG